MRRTFFWTCPECGANLDPGEKCDCWKEKCTRPDSSQPSARNKTITPASYHMKGGAANGPVYGV